MRYRRVSACSLAVFFLIPLWALAALSDDAVREQIRERVEHIQSGEGLQIEGTSVASEIVLPAFYEQRGFAPVWTNHDSVAQLLNALRTIDQDGLDPADYHLAALEVLQRRLSASETPEPARQADFDLLLTDSLVRLGYHLLIGKVDPVELDNNWNMDRTLPGLDPVLQTASAIENGTVDDLIESLRPQDAIYPHLKRALARYRGLAAKGGWQPVPPGAALKPGMRDVRVKALRRRLVVTDDMQAGDPESDLFDATLEAGVKHFQRRHGLEADGVVGTGTLAALNVPVEARIDQIRANLERARWVLHDLPDEYVLVDIAGFNVRYFRDGNLVWETRAQVGKPYRRTPVFKSRITYLVMNPTWTVPPTILRQDILPKVRVDPGYLDKKNLRVIDRDGKVIDAAAVDWSKYPGAAFPYMLRQDPGPTNALGRIKFMFPNAHAVYLHDTPSRSLFERSERAFSSGCIRIENPDEFAALLLNDEVKWNQQNIVKAIDSLETMSVSLPRPVTVLLLYWTVGIDARGDPVFKQDIYQRDPAVVAALAQRFQFRKRPVIRE
jgi:murein L,D-transpeptidase YcbB/YkuD